ncbi:MAG: YihY/virulence factor BrkB family protein, partial [Gemmataceae bacterium]|nr:YihY/virulence factor BrkB family protein [Gemmataceae bacterium]
MRWHDVWEVVKQTGREFMEDKAMRLGAALSFYTALSLAPLLLVVIGIAGLVFGPEAARGELAAQLKDLIGAEGADAVQDMLAKTATTGGGVLSTVVGVVTLLVGATGVFGSLQDALDTVWNVKPDQTPSGIWGMVRDRLLSFGMVCGMAFLLLVSLVLSALLTALGGAVERWLPGGRIWLQLGNLVIGFLVTAAMFALIFKVLPHARPAWKDVWVGALLTAGLFTLGKYLIGLYLGTASVGSAYGAAGSFVVLLFWIYYSSLIVLFGAEFTQVYALKH